MKYQRIPHLSFSHPSKDVPHISKMEARSLYRINGFIEKSLHFVWRMDVPQAHNII